MHRDARSRLVCPAPHEAGQMELLGLRCSEVALTHLSLADEKGRAHDARSPSARPTGSNPSLAPSNLLSSLTSLHNVWIAKQYEKYVGSLTNKAS